MPRRLAMPRALALLGLSRGLIVENDRGDVRKIGAGLALCASGDGSELFFLRIGPAKGRQRFLTHRAAQAADVQLAYRLRAAFTDRSPEGLVNATCPPPGELRAVGWALLIRYFLDRGEEGPQEWEHYFSGDGAPHPVQVWDIGHDQLWIPPGAFVAGAGGIRYRRET